MAVVLPSPKRLNPAGKQPYVLKRAELIYSIMLKRGVVPLEFEMAPGSLNETSAPEGKSINALPPREKRPEDSMP
jgi:hypothetical protein